MRSIPEAAERQSGVFTRRQALDAGWTRSALAHAVRTGRLWQPREGVFALPLEPDLTPIARQRAWLLRLGVATGLVVPAVLSHGTALIALGLPTMSVPEQPCLTVRPRYTGDTRLVHLHRARLWRTDLMREGDVWMTRAARSVMDEARENGFEAGVVAADAALHLGWTTVDQLHEVLDHCAHWPGVTAARRAVAFADGRTESVLESLSRMRFVDIGFPAPEPQVDLRDRSGRFIRRVDFYWEGLGLAGEVDGRQKYRGDGGGTNWYAEKEQEEALRDLNLEVVRWGKAELDAPDRLKARLDRAARRCASRTADRLWTATPSGLIVPPRRVLTA